MWIEEESDLEERALEVSLETHCTISLNFCKHLWNIISYATVKAIKNKQLKSRTVSIFNQKQQHFKKIFI